MSGFDRRTLLAVLAALPAGAMAAAAAAAGSAKDFDWFIGDWRVKHRRLRARFAGSNDWEAFEGTTRCQALLGGVVNLNESQGRRESGAFHGMGLRAYDAKTDRWFDWYLTASDPTNLGAPGIGRFEGKVGTFLSDEEIGRSPPRCAAGSRRSRRARPPGSRRCRATAGRPGRPTGSCAI